MVGFWARGRVRIKIRVRLRVRVRVRVMFNASVYQWSNCGMSKCCTFLYLCLFSILFSSSSLSLFSIFPYSLFYPLGNIFYILSFTLNFN